MKHRIAVLLMLGLMPWIELHAQSQSAETTFRVTAKVNAVCAVTASDLAFGDYSSAGGTPVQGTTVLKATCTPGTTYNIGLNDGAGGGTIYTSRQMASGTNKLNYQLYRDSARTNVWGNTTGTDTVQDVGIGVAKDHTVFGAIPAAQVVPAGAYADTITVRIYY
jgi:spore coat protein U-like protein